MAEDKTLLAHLAPMLGSSIENIAVEALGHILSTSKAALGAIEDLLKAGGAGVGAIRGVQTQDSDERGRPDLSGCDDNGEDRVLIEAKFWAGLTERQPVDYLNRLPTDKPSALLFVAPRARFESLWAELQRRVTDKAGLDLESDKSMEHLRSAVVSGERRLMLTSWKALLESMAFKAGISGDSRAEIDIRQLLGLAQREDKEAFLPLRSEELGPEFPRRVLGYRRLVGDVATRVSQEDWANKIGSRPSSGETYYGWNLLIAGAGAWFGFSFGNWARHRDTPLWLNFYTWRNDRPRVKLAEVRRRLAPLLQEIPPGIIDTGRRLLVPIGLPEGVEYETVLDTVVERLESIAGLIDSPDTRS